MIPMPFGLNWDCGMMLPGYGTQVGRPTAGHVPGHVELFVPAAYQGFVD